MLRSAVLLTLKALKLMAASCCLDCKTTPGLSQANFCMQALNNSYPLCIDQLTINAMILRSCRVDYKGDKHESVVLSTWHESFQPAAGKVSRTS